MFQILNHKNFSKELEIKWNLIENLNSCYVFQSYDWLKNWHDNIGQNQINDLNILEIYIDNYTLMIAPLCFYSCDKMKILRYIGEEHSDYNVPLINFEIIDKKNINYKNLFNFLKNSLPKNDIVSLKKQPEYYSNNKKNNFLQISRNKISNLSEYYIFPKNYDEIFSDISKKKQFNEIKRQIKKLEELGDFKFIISNNNNEKKSIINELINMKSKKFSDTFSIKKFNDKSYINFYYGFINFNSKKILPHFSALYIDNLIIASHFGFVFKNRFYYLIPAYKNLKKYNRFSPGKILMQKLILWSYKNNLSIFDLTIGRENYKKKWSNKKMNIYDSYIISSFMGYIYYIYVFIINIVKKNKILKNFLLKIVNYYKNYN